jgi:hypothetical protein
MVEQDCSSGMLISKKALIVENHTNFSHILACQSFKHSFNLRDRQNYSGGKTSFRFNAGTKQDT